MSRMPLCTLDMRPATPTMAGMCSAALVDPPVGSDVIEDWEFFWGLAQRMGSKIAVTQYYGNGPQAEHPPYSFTIDPQDPKPTTDRLIELSTATDKPDEAAKWRAGRARYPFVAPMPRAKG